MFSLRIKEWQSNHFADYLSDIFTYMFKIRYNGCFLTLQNKITSDFTPYKD